MPKITHHQSISSKSLVGERKERLFSLDLLKAISITAVVSFHSVLVPRTTYESSILAIDILFYPLKFCVPVLLTISFLLFEKSLAKETGTTWSVIKKRLSRLLAPTLFWFCITAFLKLLAKNSLFEIIGSTLNGQIFAGAYYLLVLFQFFPIYIILRHWLNNTRYLILTILLQSVIFLGVFFIPICPDAEQILNILKMINRPFFIYWFVYITLGAYAWKNWSSIVKLSNQIPIIIKASLLIIYSLLMMGEYSWVFLRFEGKIPPFDYILFSCILSVIVMFLCFASVRENQLPALVVKLVTTLSKYSLGIFCINGILTQAFDSLGKRYFSEATFNFSEILMIKLVTWVVLLTISLVISIFLNRIKLKSVVC